MKVKHVPQLRQERERRGWSRNYVSERVEVDVVTVGRWERGERLPHPLYRQRLCELFEMNAEDLGLFTEDSPEDAENPEKLLEQNNQETQKPDDEVYMLEETATVTDLPERQKAHDKIAPPPSRQRRRLLIGLGGLGVAALTGGGIILATQKMFIQEHVAQPALAHQAQPGLPLIETKPLQQLLYPIAQNWINRMAWSPDSFTLAAATGTNIVSIWDMKQGTLINSYLTLNAWVNDVSWSPTNWIAAATAQVNAGSLEIWQYPNAKATFKLQRSHSLRGVSWSPDGKTIVISGRSPTVEVWNPFTQTQISTYTYPALPSSMGINRVRWSPSGLHITCGVDDGSVHVWEALTGKAIAIYRKHKGRVIDLTWSPNGDYIASCGVDGTTQVWEAMTGQTVLIYKGQSGTIEGVDWSLQGKYIATGGTDHTTHVWGAMTGKLMAKYENTSGTIETVLWSKDGTTVATGSNSQGIEIWRAPTAS